MRFIFLYVPHFCIYARCNQCLAFALMGLDNSVDHFFIGLCVNQRSSIQQMRSE